MPVGESVTYQITTPSGYEFIALFFAVKKSAEHRDTTAVINWNSVVNTASLYKNGADWYLEFKPVDTAKIAPYKYVGGIRGLTSDGKVKSFWPDGKLPTKDNAWFTFELTGGLPTNVSVVGE